MATKFGPNAASTSNTLFTFDAGNKRSYDNRENILSGSPQFTGWGANATPVIALNGGVAPDGSNTAVRWTSTADNQGYYTFFTPVANKKYTYSVYVKHLSGTGVIKIGSDGGNPVLLGYNVATRATTIISGSPTNITVLDVGNGWYRVSFQTTTTAAVNSSIILYYGSATAASYLTWGYKVEFGEGPTDYIYSSDQFIRQQLIRDPRGNSFVGTLVNTPAYSINNGGTLLFDGTDDHITFSPQPLFATSASIELWFKSTSTVTSWIIGAEGCWRITQNGTSINTVMATSNNGWYSAGTPVDVTGVTTTNWNHLVFVYDGSFNRAYLNGVLAGTGSQAISGTVLTGTNIEIAKPNAAGFSNWPGYLGPVTFYTSALTATQVKNNFDTLRGRFGI